MVGHLLFVAAIGLGSSFFVAYVIAKTFFSNSFSTGIADFVATISLICFVLYLVSFPMIHYWALLFPTIFLLISFAIGTPKLITQRQRAKRSVDKGNISQALRFYAQAGDISEVHRVLRGLPKSPIQGLLIDAAAELLQLEKSAVIAQKAGVSRVTTQHLMQQTQQATNALWARVERIASVADQRVAYDAVERLMNREAMTLQRLIQATRKNREALAALTLSGGSQEALEDAERALGAFGEVIGDLNVLS